MGGRFSRARAERRAARVHARDLMADEGAHVATLAWSEVGRRISITAPLVHGVDDGSEIGFAEFGEERMGAEEDMHAVAGASHHPPGKLPIFSLRSSKSPEPQR